MYYALRTISYFLTWGVLYGILLGGLTGMAVLPLVGPIVGVLLGLGAGLVGGVIAGLAAIAYKATDIDFDTNLELHRRQVAWQVGLSVVLVPFLIWAPGSFLIRGLIQLGLLLPLTLPWAGLAAAYVAHRYPDVIVKEMTKGKHGQLDDYEEDLQPQEITSRDSWAILWRSGSRKLRMLIGAGTLGFTHWQVIAQVFNGILPARSYELILAGIAGAIAAELIWGYVTLANSLLLTFVKKIILHDYFPEMPPVRYRRILTAITFCFTLLISWWAFVLAPVIAALSAYSVYYHLALPPESLEKAKRKQKNALALEDDEDEYDMEDNIAESLRENIASMNEFRL